MKKTETKKPDTIEYFNVYDNWNKRLFQGYTIKVVNKKKYTLSYSDNSSWTPKAKGKKILTVTNMGDFFKIRWMKRPMFKKMGYSEAAHLQIILNFINEGETRYVYEQKH